jgi:hypothetical protein
MAASLFRDRFLLTTVVACLVILPSSGRAAPLQPVSLELVLAIDCSLSVSDREFALQIEGIANAFRDEEVIGHIAGRSGGVAATVMQWNGTSSSHQEPPWRVLTDRGSVLAFAHEIEATRRFESGYHTAIGRAIDSARRLIAANSFAGHERKIDISGDGRNNAGPDPSEARARALGDGIVINGLAVIDADPELVEYYETSVAGGPGSFVVEATAYSDFAEAMRTKLRAELLQRLSMHVPR